MHDLTDADEAARVDGATRVARRGERVLVGAALLLLGGVALAIWLLTLGLAGGRGTDWGSFYAAGAIVRSAEADQLFDLEFQEETQKRLFGRDAELNGFPLPTFVAYAMAPVSSLDFRLSYSLWFMVNAGVLLSLLLAMRRHLGAMPHRDRRLYLAVTAVSAPVVALLAQGQLDLIILASMLGCMALMSKDHRVLAGVVLAVGVAKPHFVAPVVLLLAMRGEWRTLAAFSCAGGGLLLLPLALGQPHLLADQASVWWAYPSSADDGSVNAPMMVNLRGAITSIRETAGVFVWGPPLASAGVAALLLSVKRWLQPSVQNAQAWALAMALPIVYSPHVHFHSLVFLLAGLTLFVGAAVDAAATPKPTRLVMLHLTLLILWFVSSAIIGLVSFVVLAMFAVFVWRWPTHERVASVSASHASVGRESRPQDARAHAPAGYTPSGG